MKIKHITNILSRFTSDNVLRPDNSTNRDRLEIAAWLKLSCSASDIETNPYNQLISLLLKYTDSQGQKTLKIDTILLPNPQTGALFSGVPTIKSVGQITQMDLFVQDLPDHMKLTPESIHIKAA